MERGATFTMTIDGRAVASPLHIPVANPANAEVFAEAPDCTPEQLDAAVAAAQSAFRSWRETSFAARERHLRNAAAVLRANNGDLARIFTREHGRPVDGALAELEDAARWLEAAALMRPPVQVIEDNESQKVETRYVPLGVVCAIAPWNFPVSLAIWKIAPALMAGNTVVLKPSPFTPLCTLKIGELFRQVFPPGVLNVISGGDGLGPLMTTHPGFAKVSFTGSTATGRKVMESAARTLKRVTLELGGNDAAIVMPDVDVDAVAEKIFVSSFYNSSQICIATKRLYVHHRVYEQLRDRLAAFASATRMGDGSQQGVVLGPIQNERQFRRVRALLDDARAQGLNLIEAGAVPDAGYFVPVTIVDNPPEDAAVVQEEAFGPVLPMLRFTDVDDVIARANASPYGLGASVWSKDATAALAIAKRLEAGSVWINQTVNVRPDTPFAGHKQSGVGAENGVDGFLSYMQPQSIYLARE